MGDKVWTTDDDDLFREEVLAEASERIAAQVRQLFRAQSAYDQQAFAVSLQHLAGHLTNVLSVHLRQQDPHVWDFAARSLDCLGEARAVSQPPGSFHMRSRMYCQFAGDRFGGQWVEPFVFSAWIDEQTGCFLGYRFQFSDSKPLASKGYLGPIPSADRTKVLPAETAEGVVWVVVVTRGQVPNELLPAAPYPVSSDPCA